MHVLRVPLVSVRIEPFGFVRRPLLPAALLTRRWEQCGDERVAGNGFVFVQIAEATDEQILDAMAFGELVRAATNADVEAALDLQQRLRETQIPRVGRRFSMLEDYHAPAQEAVRAWVERMRALERDAQIKAALSTFASDTFAGGAAVLHGRTLNNGGGGSGAGTWNDASAGSISTDGAGAAVVNNIGGGPFYHLSDGTPVAADMHVSALPILGSAGGTLLNMGMFTRLTRSSSDGYFAWSSPASGDALYKAVGGSFSQIAGGGPVSVGTRWGCHAIGTTISRTIGGAIDVTATGETDHASGTGGALIYIVDHGIKIDDYTIEVDAGTASGVDASTSGGGSAVASATFSAPTFAGVGASAMGGAANAATATFSPPAFHGSGASVAGGASSAAAATINAPVFSASGTATAGGAASAGAAIFAASLSAGVGTSVSGGASGAAVASFVAPVFSGSGTVVAGGGRCAATGAFSPPTSTGTATCAVGGARVGSAAAFVAPTFSASAACDIGGARVFASAAPPGVVPAIVIALEQSSIHALEGSRP